MIILVILKYVSVVISALVMLYVSCEYLLYLFNKARKWKKIRIKKYDLKKLWKKYVYG